MNKAVVLLLFILWYYAETCRADLDLNVLWCPIAYPRSRNAHLRSGDAAITRSDMLHDMHGITNKVRRRHTGFRRGYRWAPIRTAPIHNLMFLCTPVTTPEGPYWNLTTETCDYMRFRCKRSSMTGAVCARTLNYQYTSFQSYCIMEYHNCLARYDNVWTVAHMGTCAEDEIDPDLYVYMTYEQMSNFSKLRQMYVADSADQTDVGGYAPTALIITTETGTTESFLDFFTEDVSNSTVSDSTVSGSTVSGSTISGSTVSGSVDSGSTVSGSTVSGSVDSGSTVSV